MKRLYSLLLSTLLLVVGGVEVSATVFYEYDFKGWYGEGGKISYGNQYKGYNDEGTKLVANYMKTLTAGDKVYDISRFASRENGNETDSGKGWWPTSQGLRGQHNNGPEFIISHLLSGDKITLTFWGGEGIIFCSVSNGQALLNGNRALTPGTIEGNNNYYIGGDNSIKSGDYIQVTADCDLIIRGTGNHDGIGYVYLEKVVIERQDYGDYTVENDPNNDFLNIFKFTTPGKLMDDARKVTDVFGITMELGNLEKSNNVEIGEDLSVKIYADDGTTHTHWNNKDGDNDLSGIKVYRQGTFYIFKPSVSGKLTIDGFYEGAATNPLVFAEFDKNENHKVYNGEGKNGNDRNLKDGYFNYSVDLIADHIYCLHAYNGNGTTDTYRLKSFTYEANFHFPKKSVVINGKLPKDVVTTDGNTTTYYAEKDLTEGFDRGQIVKGDNITYTCIFKGKKQHDVVAQEYDDIAQIDKQNGTWVSWDNQAIKGGAIVVTAKHTDPDSDREETTQYVITIPYKTNEWIFYDETKTENKLDLYANTAGSKSDWDLAWKVFSKDDNDIYINQLDHPVFSNAVKVEGDNARFIDATAGLIFEAPSKSFGTNIEVTPYSETKDNKTLWGTDPNNRKEMSGRELNDFLIAVHTDYNLEEHVKDESIGNAVTMRKGSKLIIPNLEAGQHIRFRWNHHVQGTGDKMKATNVLDLRKQPVKDVFYTGSGSNQGNVQGHQEFIVETSGDVTFELIDNEGWVNIFNIKVDDGFIGTHLNIKTIDKDSYKDKDGNEIVTATYNVPDQHNDLSYNGHPVLYTYMRKAGEEPIKTKMETARGQIHMQSSLDQVFEIEDRTGTLTPENCKMGEGDDWNILYIGENAHGSFTLIQKGILSASTYNTKDKQIVPYMLDSLRVKVEVYEYDYNVKPYPYTWAMEHFTTNTGNNTVDELGKDLEEKTLNKDNSCNTTNMSYWTQDGSSYKFNVGYPENMIAWKKRTEKGNVKQTATYQMTEGERMVAGQTVPVKQKTVVNGKDVYETVATVTFGERSKDENGNDCHLDEKHVFKAAEGKDGAFYTPGSDTDGGKKGGTSYTIIPKYDGTINVDVYVNTDKVLCVYENDKEIKNSKIDKGKQTIEIQVKEGQHYKIYADGSNNLGFYGLTYKYATGGELYVPEMDGLGIMPKEYWKVSDSDWKLGDSDLKLTPSQQGLVFGNREYTLKVPEVQEGQTVYLALTKNNGTGTPSVTLADGIQGKIENVGQGIVYDDIDAKGYVEGVFLDIYKIEGRGKDGKGEDIDICIKNYTLHKLAVSVDTKDVYKDTGYATEAREYPLDMTLARLFLGKEQKAYTVTGVDEDKVTTKEIKFVPMAIDCTPSYKNGVMLSGDYVGLEAGDDKTSWPLFTTDINRAISDTEMDDNYLIGVVAQVNANVNKEGIIDQIETVKGANGEDEYYYNYLLACRGFNVKYSDREDPSKPSDPVTDVVVGNVTGVGFYLVIRKGTKMSANDNVGYPGGRPKDHSAYMKLNQWLAKINPLNEPANAAGVHQVFFIDFDNIETDIKDILTDDELSTTDNNSANLLQNGVFYTLQGVPVKNPTKGIYIFNGKKVYVK